MIHEENLDEPRYVISVVTKLVDLHPQTLRHYENVGLVVPSRTKGNIRLYSQRDVELLLKITRLTRDLGINLAGVEVVLQMTERLETLQCEMEKIQEEVEFQMQALRQNMYHEILQTLREIEEENGKDLKKIIKDLEARL